MINLSISLTVGEVITFLRLFVFFSNSSFSLHNNNTCSHCSKLEHLCKVELPSKVFRSFELFINIS
ncbi:hypothetical protein CAEBREN_25206 [Caenorhabditis brenneri]|uniref:Uncharacterized protein n=1 Tax=Caenorhabditis brenneri TaxID=135651 RepID=G0NZW5_CAEBE|nr:hypothetical protein CAEBREN_25206 [Caenorhabditis brenneri]